jgi:hypothetical protein
MAAEQNAEFVRKTWQDLIGGKVDGLSPTCPMM